MKRIVVALLCLLLILPSGALAADPTSSTLDSRLVELGYPLELIQVMDEDLKETLVTHQSVYVGSFHSSQPLKGAADQGEITPQISDGDYHNTLILSEEAGRPGMRTYRVSYTWTWLFSPLATFVDKVGVAWEDGWDFVEDSVEWKYTCHSDIYYQNELGANYEATGVLGVGYHFDILSGFDYFGQYMPAEWHSGYFSWCIQKSLSGQSGNDSISFFAKYFHQDWPGPSGSLTFDNLSINIGNEALYSSTSGEIFTKNFTW